MLLDFVSRALTWSQGNMVSSPGTDLKCGSHICVCVCVCHFASLSRFPSWHFVSFFVVSFFPHTICMQFKIHVDVIQSYSSITFLFLWTLSLVGIPSPVLWL